MKIKFACKICNLELTRDSWEYKKTINHFCSKKCAKIFRNQNIAPIPEVGTRKFQLIFLNTKIINNRTKFVCQCDCGCIISIPRNKFGVYKTCGLVKNHKGKEHRCFRGYQDISASYWDSIKRGAKLRNLSFNITIEDAWNLFVEQDKTCALSGLPINLDKNKDEEKTASLDRIDSNLGYELANVQWIHKDLNVMKMNFPNSYFIDMCTHIANYSGIVRKLDFNDVFILPQRSTLNSRADVNLTINPIDDIFPNVIPIITSNIDTIGTFAMAKVLSSLNLLTCLHKYYDANQYINFFKVVDKSKIFYSTGTIEKDLIKLKQVYENCGIINICLDVANAYIPQVIDTIGYIQSMIPNSILMVGNIATPDIIQDFAKKNVQILKVGIGSGGVCQTRTITGIGVPQLGAIIDCVKEANKYNIKICSDGGCKSPADLVKSFGAGASMVMIGSMLSGCEECEGEWKYSYSQSFSPILKYEEKWITNKDIENQNIKDTFDSRFIEVNSATRETLVRFTKITHLNEAKKISLKFYGMSSKEAMNKYSNGVANYRASEGICIDVPYKGPVEDVITEILGGLRSACTYVGASTLKELSKRTTFIRLR